MEIKATGLPKTIEDYQVALNAAFSGGRAFGEAVMQGRAIKLAMAEANDKRLEALAQPEQEPVAWLVYAKGSRKYFTLTFDLNKVPEIYVGGEAVPLYTTPQQRTWVAMTEEDFVCVNQLCKTPLQAAAYTEQLLKEKNT